MSDAIEFDRDLYRGTAGDYDRHRVPYPRSMLCDLPTWVQPSGHGRLLDLACGTGQVAFAIADRFAEVWAVDQEPDMVELVREKAQVGGAGHLRAVVSRAEELNAPAGGFELVSIGNAFHRLRRDTVAESAFLWLRPGGSIALLWATSPWAGEEGWQRALSAVLERWKARLEARDRVPRGWNQAREQRPDLDVLVAAGFKPVHSRRFPTVHEWTVEGLIGFVYSTSFLPRTVLGDCAGEFENDVRREVGGFTTAGRLRQTIDFAYELARRRQ